MWPIQEPWLCGDIERSGNFRQLPTISHEAATKTKMTACAEQTRLRSELESV